MILFNYIRPIVRISTTSGNDWFSPTAAYNNVLVIDEAYERRQMMQEMVDALERWWKGTAPYNIAVEFLKPIPRKFLNDVVRPLAFAPRRWMRRPRAVRHKGYLRNFYKMA